MEKVDLKRICRQLIRDILMSTTAAGSGHPSSCLSAVELMATLFFSGLLNYKPNNSSNDKVIFSKGHAAPLLYSIFRATGEISLKELLTLRKFGSRLEGHPTPRLPQVEVATGSCGQGLSIGVGMAFGAKLKNASQQKIWVLIGDSEMTEGQIWEAVQIAHFYKLNNLIGIIDVNRFGLRGETMLGWDIKTYKARLKSFGWNVLLIKDGHDLGEIEKIYKKALVMSKKEDKPIMIVAKTIKGKGISFKENLDWHGKILKKDELSFVLEKLN